MRLRQALHLGGGLAYLAPAGAFAFCTWIVSELRYFCAVRTGAVLSEGAGMFVAGFLPWVAVVVLLGRRGETTGARVGRGAAGFFAGGLVGALLLTLDESAWSDPAAWVLSSLVCTVAFGSVGWLVGAGLLELGFGLAGRRRRA